MRATPHQLIAVLSLLTASLPALAGERLLVVRTTETLGVSDPALCATAPFATNLTLGATVWSVRTRKKTGEVRDDQLRQVGTANACVRLTNLTFAAGTVHDMLIRFSLDDGDYTAVGTCTVTSNNVPQGGLILAGCNLRLASGPAGVLGGSVNSSTVFNPFKLPGFSTGSFWTLHLYTSGPSPAPGPASDDD